MGKYYSHPYMYEAFEWISPTTGSVTLAFQFRHDSNTWYLDDVSVYNATAEMLTNESFESGTESPWVRTTPNGPCTRCSSQVSTTIYGVLPHTGTYYYILSFNLTPFLSVEIGCSELCFSLRILLHFLLCFYDKIQNFITKNSH